MEDTITQPITQCQQYANTSQKVNFDACFLVLSSSNSELFTTAWEKN